MTNPYETVRKQSLSGRDLEREVLARVNARLEAPDRAEPGAFERAIEENRRIWMAFAADLAHPDNACPDELKAGLISLAGFVERHSGHLLTNPGDAGALIEINRNIILGLAGAAAEAA